MQHRGALDPGGFARQHVGDFDLPAAAIRPALVHAQEHFAQSRASVPPAPALMLKMQLLRSCGPLREDAQFQRVELLEEAGDVGFQFLLDAWPVLPRGSASPSSTMTWKSSSCFSASSSGSTLLRREVGFVDELLRLLAVVPESLRRHQGIRARPGVLARRRRQRNLRRCASFSRGGGQLGFDDIKHNAIIIPRDAFGNPAVIRRFRRERIHTGPLLEITFGNRWKSAQKSRGRFLQTPAQ